MLHKTSNDNGVIVNFATSKFLFSKVQRSHIIAVKNILNHLLMEKLLIKLTIIWYIGEDIQLHLRIDSSGSRL
jgi:hypothetical protein